jgi:DNA-binding transcriptional LysR family regulator
MAQRLRSRRITPERGSDENRNLLSNPADKFMNPDAPLPATSLRQLRAFMEVYRWRKLSAAAERLSLTPSAVSVLIRQLEAAAGASLFDRTTRSLSPTGAAHEMLPIAERILRDVHSLESSFRGRAAPSGRIAIAVTPTIALTLVPPVIRHFNDLHPGVRVQLVDCETEQFVPRILSEQVDFGIGSLDREVEELSQRTLMQDHLSLACLRSHPLAHRRQLRWVDLAGHPVIAVKAGYGIRDAIDRTAARAGVRLEILQEVSLLTTALAMSAADLGAAIVPAGLVTLSGFGELVAKKLYAPVVVRNISVVAKKNRTPSLAARTFVEVMQAFLAHRPGAA